MSMKVRRILWAVIALEVAFIVFYLAGGCPACDPAWKQERQCLKACRAVDCGEEPKLHFGVWPFDLSCTCLVAEGHAS